MSNLKEIRSRISSVSSTMKITSAMKMVSAAKLKKAQDRMQNIRPFSTALTNMILNLVPSVNTSEIKLLSSFCKTDRTLLITVSSNRGLCGGFNANIFKKGVTILDKKTELFCIGKKCSEQFVRKGHNVLQTELDILDQPSLHESQKISKKIIDQYLEGRWSKVILIYNQFKNAATQDVVAKQILPISQNINKEQGGVAKNTGRDYIFEPNKESIVNNLMPQQIHTQIFGAILNSIASEHGARMTAMHKATDNANELKQNLKLSYNRQRQAAITNEILEIVAGAEALKNT